MSRRENAKNQLCIFLTDDELDAVRQLAAAMGYSTVDECVEQLTVELAQDALCAGKGTTTKEGGA